MARPDLAVPVKVVRPARIAARAILAPSRTIALLPSTALTVPERAGENFVEIVFMYAALFGKPCHEVVRGMYSNFFER